MQEQSGTSVSELSEAVDLTVGTVHTHLATLKDHGFVVQEGNTYWLGPQLIPLGEYVKHHSDLYRASKREIDRVAEETGECVHLMVENNGQSIILYEAFGDEAVGTKYHTRSREMPSEHLHYRAAGKSILAHLPASRVHETIDEHGLPAATEKTVTNKEELINQLAEIRSRGYALNDEEELRGIRAVGAPILCEDGDPYGAISISAPCSRLKGETFEEDYPELVVATTNIIEINYQTGELSIE